MRLPQVNVELLRMKAHFFLFVGGLSPLTPFLTTVARQRGYSALLVGAVFSAVSAVAVLSRPAFGAVTDRYRCRKTAVLCAVLALALITASQAAVPEPPADVDAADDAATLRTYQFWSFAVFLAARYVTSNACVTLSETMCLQSLGKDSHKFGQQRFSGCIAWGSISVISGWLIDWYSDGKPKKDYTPGIILWTVLLLTDALIVYQIKDCQSDVTSKHMIKDIKKFLINLKVLRFFIIITFFGIFNTSISLYLLWHIEELVTKYHPEKYSSITTIQGALIFVKCIGGEALFFFISGNIIEKLGHMNSILIGLVTLSVRFFLYFIITDPLWVLPVEVLSGLGYALPYSAMAAYGAILAPECLKGTIHGLIGFANQGVGLFLGNIITGYLFDKIGSSNAYLVMSVMALAICFVQAIIMCLVNIMTKFKMKENDKVNETV